MDSEVAELVDDSALREALRRYGGTTADAAVLSSEGMNRVYEFGRGGSRRILRIAKKAAMTAEMTQAEVDWIDYLHLGGLPVCRSVYSEHGRKVEVVHDGGSSRVVTAFEKAPGRPVQEEDWNPALFARVGRVMGRMHALSRAYRPDPRRPRRFEWAQSIYLSTAHESIPTEETKLWQSYDRLCRRLGSLPRSGTSFGLIHCDLRPGNFFVDGTSLWLFDFDGCEYNWYVNDIAVSLFYATLFEGATPEEKAKEFLPALLDGYLEENPLDRFWIDQIPVFLKLREFIFYSLILDWFRGGAFPSWATRFMTRRKERIENGEPYLRLEV